MKDGQRTYQAPLVCELAVTAHEGVARDGLPKDLDSQHVGNNVLRLSVNVGVHERHVIVAHDAVAQRRQPLLDALHHHAVGQRVPQMQQLTVGACARHQQTLAVAHRHAPHKTTTGNARVHYGNMIR